MYLMGINDLKKVCKFQMEFADEEGFYDSFLCCKDYSECDGLCSNHRPKLNDLVAPFMNRLNEVLNG